MKQKVMIEHIDDNTPDKVAVYEFEDGVVGELIEVTDLTDASITYKIVGYLDAFEAGEDYEYDYYDEFGIEEDE